MCVGAPVLAIAGMGLQAVSSISSGMANSDAARTAAAIAASNAKTAMIEASGRIGAVDDKVRRTIGQERASYGAANIDVNSGSPLLVQAFSAAQGNIDKQLEAAKGLNQSAGQNYQAAQYSQKAADSLAAGYLGAGTALLGGAYRWKALGAGGGGVDPGYASVSVDPMSAYGMY